uniref:Uncharacterized protein n=1 Tax=Ananas comosus var. bracteatus TaxID=296719 RepID=A0A6V7Q3Q9_ANACO|nr:unnamed protein product [Ananas comosus var. bracteatus]
MKRPRSHGEDLDDEGGEKGVWGRREQDPERSSLSSSSSSHRRFYAKGEGTRKGPPSSSSAYDRALDDDREPLHRAPPPRKRTDYEIEGFDRRKGFDRYRDAPSPRGVYGGERMHRSESFSVLRREFPKGFRSERDRSGRREAAGVRRGGDRGSRLRLRLRLRPPLVMARILRTEGGAMGGS